jgi:molecular chaperone GrpE
VTSGKAPDEGTPVDGFEAVHGDVPEQPVAPPAESVDGAQEPPQATGELGPDAVAPAVGQAIEGDLAAAQTAVAGLTNDLQRLQAEYVNYKRRVDRDRELVLENAKFSVLASLLPVLDDLDRAREHGELEGGFKAVADALERIVSGQGLLKFGAPGDAFDPRLHEALMHSHSPDVTTTTCQNIVTAGYKIGDRVVRPARVTVVDPEPGGETTDGASDEG